MLMNVDVTNKPLLVSCANARHKFVAFLEEQKKMKAQGAADKKRKAVTDEIQELQKKKQYLQTDIEALSTAADEFSEQAEKSRKFQLIAKPNGMRKAAKLKRQLVQAQQEVINKLQHQLEFVLSYLDIQNTCTNRPTDSTEQPCAGGALNQPDPEQSITTANINGEFSAGQLAWKEVVSRKTKRSDTLQQSVVTAVY